jgi:hypothetical protein
VTGSGAPIELVGAVNSIYFANEYGFASVELSPGSSTDFLATSNVNIEFPGGICYTNNGGSSCMAVNFTVPALSLRGTGALAGMLLLFGAWMLKTERWHLP